jgi:ABC-2 type transport system ATP-binding protein
VGTIGNLEAPLLSLVNLSKRFGDIVALERASFDVPAGRIVGFLGPNGAGKTTAMRCIFDLVHPDTGEVLWGDGPVGPAERLRFGYMPEERGLYPKMKVGDQLTYFARLSGRSRQEARQDAAEWLTQLGLIDRADSKLEELSHGNQQRVQLAAALVHNPELAVLDEPFSGLDPIGMESMAQTLRELAGRGVGIVFSSHQLDTVEDLCQDVVIIDRGRIVLTGELARLRASAGVRHLVIEVDDVPWNPDGDDIKVVSTPTGDRRLLVEPDVDLDALLVAARAAGTVTRFSFEPPRLSDLFREAIQ